MARARDITDSKNSVGLFPHAVPVTGTPSACTYICKRREIFVTENCITFLRSQGIRQGRLEQAQLPIVELRAARMLRGVPQLSEEPLHPLPRSVRIICARQLVELELDQQLQLFPGKDSAPAAAVEKMSEHSGALDR